jgi:hypothetical protein
VSQAWLVLAGVCKKEEGAAAIKNTIKLHNTVRPVTPYLSHPCCGCHDCTRHEGWRDRLDPILLGRHGRGGR